MPQEMTNSLSTTLFNFLKDRFDLECSDAEGKPTGDPKLAQTFVFDFITKENKNEGCLIISLLKDHADANPKGTVKIYYGHDLPDSSPETQKQWHEFTKQISQIASRFNRGFAMADLNYNHLTYRDVEPMFESTFGPIDGTVKTSRQPLENIEIIIKHSEKVNPGIKNSRSRRIHRIYLSNAKGERFLLPFRSLPAARAMARHILAGGTPYDAKGVALCHLVEEMLLLNRFYRAMKNEQFSNSQADSALLAARERYLEIKKLITSMTSKGGYDRNSELLSQQNAEFDDEEYDGLFGDKELDEDTQMALPHVMRAYQNNSKIKEQEEFEKWANAQSEDNTEEPLMDDDEIPERDHEFNCPDCPYGESCYPNGTMCVNCYFDKYGHSPFEDNTLDEADTPSGAGMNSPLTTVYNEVPNHFRTNKQLKKRRNTGGGMSPLSLLNIPEPRPAEKTIPVGKK